MMGLGVWEGGGIFGYRDYGSTITYFIELMTEDNLYLPIM